MPISKPATSVAVFDVDGTLIEDNIGVTFVKFSLRKNAVRFFPKVLIISVFILYKIRILGFQFAIKSGAWALAGKNVDDIDDLAEECFDKLVRPKVFSKAVAEIEKCKKEGKKIAIATGAHSVIADRLAEWLEVDLCISTQSQIIGGRFTYSIFKPIPFKEGKRDAVLSAVREKFGAAELTVYTDEKKDIPLLAIASYMVAVNPDRETRAFVTEHGGKVVDFRE
jgi:HAD superfamily phosphoserine phosphatase-like hydrolase